MNQLRRCLLFVSLLASPACLEDLQAVGPGVRLTAPRSPVTVKAGESAEVFAQVLDANDDGVDGAYVTFTRTDSDRIAWTDAPVGADAISAKTTSGDPFGIVGRGVARATFSVPADAQTGEAQVVAVLKAPARDEDTIAVRITVEVTAAGGTGGAGGDNGGSGATAGAGMGAAPTAESGAGGAGS